MGVDTDAVTDTGDAGTETETAAEAETETEMGDTRSPPTPSACACLSLASMSCSMDALSRALSGSGTSSTSGQEPETGAGRLCAIDAGLVSQCSLRLDGGGVTARRRFACAWACASDALTGTSAWKNVGLPLRGVAGCETDTVSCGTDMVIAIAIVGRGADWCRSAFFSLRVSAAIAGCTGGGRGRGSGGPEECAGARGGRTVVCAVGVASGDGRTGEPDVGVCESGEREAGEDGAFQTTDGDGRSARGVPGTGAGEVGLTGVMGVVGVTGLGVRGVRGDGNGA